MKETLVLDTECYRNVWMLKFMHVERSTMMTFTLRPGGQLKLPLIRKVLQQYRLATFNGINYDMPMIALALNGATCEELKDASDAIITKQMKPWDFERVYNVTIPELDHIDLIEVAPGKGSLKVYGGRLHCEELQDLPYDPDALLSDPEIEVLDVYCGKDLKNTRKLLIKLTPQIELREQMSDEYGQDLRSKSDAQIAEAVIKAEVSRLMGSKVARPYVEPGTTFRYHPPAFLTFTTPTMRETFDMVLAADFVVAPSGKVLLPKELKAAKIQIGDGVYRMGNGGLHSSESTVAHHASDSVILVDRDVASYYPMIILNTGLYPDHMGDYFTQVYRGIVDRRLAAKAKAKSAVDKAAEKLWKGVAETLKIVINGSFGKLGSKWSSLYSPNLMIQTTVTGQLSLLMFIEMLEEAGITVVSANTDGVVMKCHKSREAAMNAVVKEWERRTAFETEATFYRSLYSRDVNNYIAIKPNGDFKTKGAFNISEEPLKKNPVNMICVEAAVDFLVHGKPVEETVLRCRDVTKFTSLRNVRGGGVWGDQYLGKVVRWYYSVESNTFIAYKLSGNKVASTDGCAPMMDLPPELPADLDFGWYVNETYEILMDIARYVRPPKLRAARKKLVDAAQPAEEEDIDA